LCSNIKVAVVGWYALPVVYSIVGESVMAVYWFVQINLFQALKAVSHNYPSIVTACWELVSATVYSFLSIVCPEVPSKQSSEHVGSTTACINEKVLITAIKVMT